MIQDQGKLIWKNSKTKAQVVEELHNKHYPHLATHDICMVDDLDHYLVPLKALNYNTYHVDAEKQKSRVYFQEIQALMTTTQAIGLQNNARPD